jgi:hypothetical protein
MAGRLISIWVVVIAVVALILLAGWRLVSGAPLPFSAAAAGAGIALIAAIFAAGSRLRGAAQVLATTVPGCSPSFLQRRNDPTELLASF